MDLNVNVKFDATPALVGAVSTLAAALSGKSDSPRVQKTVVTDGPVTNAPSPEKEPAQPKTDAPVTEAPPVSAPATSDIADTVVREAVATQAKAGKKAEIKALLSEFGVKSSPELPQDRRAEFIQRLNAL